MFEEFKKFVRQRGSIVDLAIGIIVGAAFGKIVTSFVNDVLMPPIGLAIGGVDFTELTVTLKKATEEVPAVTINYGSFLQTVVDFGIIAIVVFMMMRALNALKRKEKEKPAPPAEPPAEVKLLTEIRDLLKAR